MSGRAYGAHESATTGTDVWLTPPDLLRKLGPFDLDPCAAPPPRPWPTATRHIALPEDGLNAVWQGRVWLNPPYSDIGRWLGRLGAHGRGTALIFARTETALFSRYVWQEASAVLFLKGRVTFFRPSGQSGKSGAGAPSVLVAYGREDADILRGSGIPGVFVPGWSCTEQASVMDGQESLFGELGEAS